MRSDKNTIIGFVLIAAIFITFSIINKPNEEEKARIIYLRDSIAKVESEAARMAQERIVEDNFAQEKLNSGSQEDSTQTAIQLQDQYGLFASSVLGEEKFFILENDLVKIKISNKGGKVYSVQLKKYKTFDSLPLILFDGDSTKFGFNFFSQRRIISTNELFFATKNAPEMQYATETGSASLALKLQSKDGQYMEYVYTLPPNSYMVNFDINLSGMDQVLEKNLTELDLNWEMYIPQQEKERSNEQMYTTVAFKHFGAEVEKFSLRNKKELQEETVQTKLRWIAFQDQFFSSVFISDEFISNAKMQAVKLPDDDHYLKQMSAQMGIPITNKLNGTIPLKMYFGPNHFKTLTSFKGYELNELINVGNSIIKVINKYVLINLFNWLNNYIVNYGLIIFILTLLIKLALLPLTYKSYISTAKMKVLKPQIDAINEKIPKEKAMERQQATMNLYKKVGVSPLGGCLPMLLQMPILIAMYRFFPGSIELRQQSFLWAHDLSTYDSIFEWETIIPILSNIYGNHISLFTILMTVTTILSMKANGQATSSANQIPGMQNMMYIMPIMFMFFLNNFSAALTYYYFLANMITLGQNFLFKYMVDEQALLSKLEAKKAKPVVKSKFQQRLEAMQKMQSNNKPARK